MTDYIIGISVIVLVGIILVKLISKHRKGQSIGCGCGCSECPSGDTCRSKKKA